MKKKSSKGQLSIFAYLKKAQDLTRQSEESAPGSLNIDAELKAAVAADLRRAKDSDGRELSRAQVAARMTDLTGREYTKATLDNWTALSHPHHISCRDLPAFTIATGCRRTFETLSRHSGIFALPGPEALRAEIQKMDEEINTLRREKQKRQLFLKEMGQGD